MRRCFIHLASHQSCSYEAVKTFLNQKCLVFDFEQRVPWVLPNDRIWATHSQREGWLWDHSLKCLSWHDSWAGTVFKKVLERYNVTPVTDPPRTLAASGLLTLAHSGDQDDALREKPSFSSPQSDHLTHCFLFSILGSLQSPAPCVHETQPASGFSTPCQPFSSCPPHLVSSPWCSPATI